MRLVEHLRCRIFYNMTHHSSVTTLLVANGCMQNTSKQTANHKYCQERSPFLEKSNVSVCAAKIVCSFDNREAMKKAGQLSELSPVV